MEPFQVFEQNILEMLNHLYDPVYRPPESLWQGLGISRESGLQALREAILSGIEDLKPAEQVPLTTRAWRIYGMLRHRYVEDLPQELTAEKLGITARHLRRNLGEAVRALSLTLWEKSGRELRAAAGENPILTEMAAQQVQGTENLQSTNKLPGDSQSAAQPGNVSVSWPEQLVRELEALEETAPGSVSNVAETISSVHRLARHLTSQRCIRLLTEPVSPSIMAAMHPSALRQVLLSIIDQLTQKMDAGEIRLSVDQSDGEVHIHLISTLLSAVALDIFEGTRELFSSFNIVIEAGMHENDFQITLTLLQVDRCVLVIDDNTDMAHLYRRYLAGTRYYLQHITHGEKAFEAIQLYQPDLVVLDVMLPDIDGWDLLTRLYENPDTRSLPVVICSVMREIELAQALGARFFLTKPVQRRDFIQALDTVLQSA